MIARLLCALLAGLGFLAGLLFALRVAPELGEPSPAKVDRGPRNARARRSRSTVGRNANPPAAPGGSGMPGKKTTGAPKRRRKKKSP